MISVIIDNYGSIRLNSLNVEQAFGKLKEFISNFLDSNLLA